MRSLLIVLMLASLSFGDWDMIHNDLTSAVAHKGNLYITLGTFFLISGNKGETWEERTYPFSLGSRYIVSSDSSLFAWGKNANMFQDYYIYRSDNGGITWNEITPPILGSNRELTDMSCFGDTIFVTYNVDPMSTSCGVFRSLDNGENWESICNGISWSHKVVTMGDIVFCYTDESKMSYDGGFSWFSSNTPPAGSYDISRSGDSLYVSMTMAPYVSFSPDKGSSWQNFGSDLVDSIVQSSECDYREAYGVLVHEGYLYLLTSNHILRRALNGGDWVILTEAPAEADPMKTFFFFENNLYAASTSVWEINLSHSNFYRIPSFENSAASVTHRSYCRQTTLEKTAEYYDILGRVTLNSYNQRVLVRKLRNSSNVQINLGADRRGN